MSSGLDDLEALEAVTGGIVRLGDLLEKVTERFASRIERLEQEQAELRDELLALSNRIEGVARLASRQSEAAG